MNKKAILIFLCFALTGIQVLAKDYNKNKTEKTDTTFEEYSFDKNQYFSDEELKVNSGNEDVIEKATFRDKLINSSHFTSTTATKTYIPMK